MLASLIAAARAWYRRRQDRRIIRRRVRAEIASARRFRGSMTSASAVSMTEWPRWREVADVEHRMFRPTHDTTAAA